jgi:RimJ/RimL family protein N-acetyltransferase
MAEGSTFETPRLIVRQWRDDDVDAWAAMNADARVMEFFPNTYDRARSESTAAGARNGLERDGYGWWPVEVKNGPRFAGVVALQEVPFEAHFTPAFEIGWRFAHDAWGHGYAPEAARAVLAFAFDRLGKSEVVALTAAINVRSQAVMRKLGMTRDHRDDFEHPLLETGHRLRRHVLYRVASRRLG